VRARGDLFVVTLWVLSVFVAYVWGMVWATPTWPHLAAFVAWARLHTSLAMPARELQMVFQLAGMPVGMTSMADSSAVMGVFMAGAAVVTRTVRRRGRVPNAD
jgi:hypothetical protein